MSENLRGILLMVVAMFCFAIEDLFIKKMGAALPAGQIVMLLGVGGTLAFGLLAWRRREQVFARRLLSRIVLLRNLGEALGAVGFVTALVLIPLSSATAILQALPLAVTLGAALFLGEPVGWRRWSAIVVGFAGVLLIVRPGLAGFDPYSLFAVLGVAGLALRDLTTRVVPRDISTLVLSVWGFLVLVPTGAVLLAISGGALVPGGVQWAQLAAGVAMGVGGYYTITLAMRMGDVAAIAPFRYSRLVFGLSIGIVVFGERPDGWTLAGAALVIGSGLYTLAREARLGRRRGALAQGAGSVGKAEPRPPA